MIDTPGVRSFGLEPRHAGTDRGGLRRPGGNSPTTARAAAPTPTGEPECALDDGGRARRAERRAGGVVPPDARLGPVALAACPDSPVTASSSSTDPAFRNLTDDLRLAHLLADDADSITMSRFKALDLHVTAKPDLTPVTDADTAVEEAIRRTLGRARPRDAVHGEEMDDTGLGPAALGDRPDRRHQELRPRGAGLGDADRADDQRRGGGRRRQRAGPGPALVGQPGRRGVRRQVADVGRPRARSPTSPQIEDASLSYSSIGGWVEAGSRPAVRRPAADLLADPRVRRLLVLHAARRGRRSTSPASPSSALHDMAACSIVVTEAGGKFTDLDGIPGPRGANAVRHQRPVARRRPGAARAPRRRVLTGASGRPWPRARVGSRRSGSPQVGAE